MSGKYERRGDPILRFKGKGSTDAQFAIGSPAFPDIVIYKYHKELKVLYVADKYGTELVGIFVARLKADNGMVIPTINGDIEPIYDPINSGVKCGIEYVRAGQEERDQFILDTGVRWIEN